MHWDRNVREEKLFVTNEHFKMNVFQCLLEDKIIIMWIAAVYQKLSVVEKRDDPTCLLFPASCRVVNINIVLKLSNSW